jgi:hypothetical protein
MLEVTLCCHLGYFDIVLVLPLSVAIDILFIGKLKTLHHSLVRMVPII